jgi:hypothetical protein
VSPRPSSRIASTAALTPPPLEIHTSQDVFDAICLLGMYGEKLAELEYHTVPFMTRFEVNRDVARSLYSLSHYPALQRSAAYCYMPRAEDIERAHIGLTGFIKPMTLSILLAHPELIWDMGNPKLAEYINRTIAPMSQQERLEFVLARLETKNVQHLNQKSHLGCTWQICEHLAKDDRQAEETAMRIAESCAQGNRPPYDSGAVFDTGFEWELPTEVEKRKTTRTQYRQQQRAISLSYKPGNPDTLLRTKQERDLYRKMQAGEPVPALVALISARIINKNAALTYCDLMPYCIRNDAISAIHRARALLPRGWSNAR